MEHMDFSMINLVVEKVLEKLSPNQSMDFIKEKDLSGVRLVKGSSVRCEKFDTGKEGDRVGLKDIFTLEESPNMAAGYMTLDNTTFDWTLTYDEVDLIIEGQLDIIVGGKKYQGKAGDCFFIPKGTSISFSSPSKARFLYVTYPANWAELAKG